MAENEQKQQASRLGTKVAYTDPEGTRRPVRVAGVPIAPGQEVDLADFLSESDARRTAERLSRNPYFRVEGGPDHEGELEQRQERLREQRARVREVTDRQRERLSRAQQESVAPEDYDAPDQAQLEGGRKAAAKTAAKKG